MRKTVKVLLAVALAVLMVCTLVACGETDTQQTGNDVNYTISFETNGGSPVANLVVDGKSEITIPQTTKEGYFFAGWFVDNGTFNVRFNLAYITANSTKTEITVYAKWSVEEVVEQTYTVAFDSNGGSAVGNIVIAAGNTIKLPADPTKTEYSFVGWFVDNNTFQIPFDLDYIKANPNNTAITLYAKWNAEHVNEKSMLTLAKNIDEAGTISGGGEKNCGLTVTVSATTNDGYVFDGWYDGSNKVSAEAVYQFTMPNDNLMLQAQWNKKAYTITLNSNGGQTLNPSTYEVFYTDNYNLPIPQREGFTFLGWYKNDVRYTNNRGASLQGWANLLNQTLKAMWEETIIEGSEFTVKYHLNYGNMEIVSRQTEQAKVSYFPERKGYTFNGWWLNSGIEGGEIVLATKWNNSDAVVHNHLVLYAEWIVESTSTIQLPAPVVSIVDGNKFVWDAITGAVGYEVVVKKDNTEVKKISITETMWQFQADLDAGNYSISFRAKGNGETNTNSQFTTKGYAHKVLPAVAEINFAEQNGYLNWTAVDIAEKYDLYINGKAVLKDTILTTFDMSFYDAGQHTVVVYAKKTGYLTSEATASFKKEHMSTPSGFKLVVDENATTTLSWDAVNHANQYRIYFKTLDSTPLIVSAPTYDILSSADCWTNATVNQKGEQTVLIYIVAIDSNAEYLNSFASVAQTIVHRQKISFANMTAGAGSFDVCVFPNIIDPDLPLLSQIVKFENVQTASYVFIIGQKIVISAKENGSKYTWLGWFDGANLCTDNADKVTPTLTYTFAMPNESKTFEARWAEYTVSLSKNINGAGTIDIGSDGSIIVNKSSVEISFNMNGASEAPPAIQQISSSVGLVYPQIPKRNGYVFAGWYSNSACTGTPYDFAAKQVNDTVLFAKWVSYSSARGVISPNSSVSVQLQGNTILYYAFIPLVSQQINISSSGTYDTWGYLYDSGKSSLASDDDEGEGNNFKISYSVTAGTLYYIGIKAYSRDVSGSCNLNVDSSLPLSGGKSDGDGALSEGSSIYRVVAGTNCTLTATTNAGYTWLGWFDGGTKVSTGSSLTYTFTMPSTNKTYTAKWMLCPVTLSKNIEAAGTVRGVEGATAVGDDFTLTATTNAGYTWLGWFDGETKVSTGSSLTYTFTMPSTNKTYTAKWMLCPVTLSKNIEAAGTVRGVEGATAVGDDCALTATTNAGYTWLGWFDGANLCTDNADKVTPTLTYTFAMPNESKTYTAKWSANVYTISLDVAGGNTLQTTEYRATTGAQYTLDVPTREGYTFRGWAMQGNENTLLTYPDGQSRNNFSYAADITVVAQWQINSYLISTAKNINSAGGITGSFYADYNSQQTITATTNAGYTWLGWFDGGTKVSTGSSLTYTFTMPSTNKTYTAKWQLNAEMEGFIFVSTPTSCTVNGYNGAKTELSVPNYVTEIASSAFSGCSNLTSITLPFVGNIQGGTTNTHFGYIFGASNYEKNATFVPASLKTVVITGGTSIGGSAFYSCYRLTSVTIGSGVTSIGYDAFDGCSGLTSITVDEGNTTYISHQGILMNKAKTAIILVPKSIKGDIVLPNSVTSIGDRAFEDCSVLTSITIPNSVKSIGEYAFANCVGLTSVTIPSGVTSIGNGAFWGCSGLTTINCEAASQPSGWSSNWKNGCNATVVWGYNNIKTDRNFDYVLRSGEAYLTKYKGTETVVTIPSIIGGYTVVGFGATFSGNTTVTSITIPASVTSIGPSAFSGCSGLTSVTIGSGVTSIGNSAFSGCRGLTSVTIGSGVTSIGDYAFEGCSGLTAITIPDSVTSIGNSAFEDCRNLTSITLPFVGGTLDGTTNTHFGYIFGAGGYEENASFVPASLKTVVITGGTSIGKDAFYNCSGLTSVTIGSGVTSIGNSAFSGCRGLTSVTIGSGVTSIGNSAFEDCRNLTSITLPFVGGTLDGTTNTHFGYIFGAGGYEENASFVPASLKTVVITGGTSIGKDAFYNCSGLTSVTIGSGVTSIGEYAFYNCSGLTSIAIGSGVTSIGHWAFSGCSGLKTINCEATSQPSGWDGSWEGNCTATVVWGYQKPTTLTFSAQGEELVPLQFAAAKGAQIAVPTAEGTAFGRSGYRILSWFEDESLTIPYVFSVMPSADKTLYGKWEYSIVGEGFLAQKEYFDSHGANFDTSVMIQNSAMLIDYIDYILFFNISTIKYARLAYLSAATIEQWQAEIDKMYKQRTYANFGINTAYGGTSPNLCFAIKAIESNKDGEAYSPRISTTAAPEQQDYFIRLYDGASRAINFDNFNINKVANTIDVTTSDQLYYALEHGYRPLPVAGSAAELILSKAKEALRGVVDDDMKDVDKIRAIFGWLIDHVEYDDVAVAETKAGAEARNYRAWYLEGVFIDGRAVCDAFAKAFTVLARIEGIPAVRVVGNGHAWNKVYLDGNGDGNFEWYVLDSTYANTSVKTSSTETTEYEVANLENFLGTDAQKTGGGNVANNYLNIVATTPINPYSQIFFVANTTTCDLVISSEAELRQLMDYCNSQKQSMTTHTQYITVDFVVEYTADETQIINTALASLAGTKLVYLSSPYGSGLKMTLLFSW